MKTTNHQDKGTWASFNIVQKRDWKTPLFFAIAGLVIIGSVFMFGSNMNEIHPAADGEAVYIEDCCFTINNSLSDKEARETLETMLRMRAQK